MNNISFFKDFIYLKERNSKRRNKAGGAGEGEPGFLLSGELDAGLDPGTPGS